MSHINVEIKARCSDLAAIRNILQKQDSLDSKGIDHQFDTYFVVPQGRLKLREGNIENSLIFYNRPNTAGPKKSDISMFKTNAGTELKTVLEKALGVKVVVDKQREIYFIDNVKFHLDTVENLGTFVEIEAIQSETHKTQEALLEQCEQYIQLFGITEKDFVDVSYSDLLLEK